MLTKFTKSFSKLLPLSVPFHKCLKIWKHEEKHECSTKQTSNWFKREKFCHAVPAITYRLYIRLINMPEQTLGELTWLSLPQRQLQKQKFAECDISRPAPPSSLPPLLCMQPIGIGIRILTMQKSSEKEEEDEENIKHERRQTLLAITWLRCWPLQASGGYANGGRCVPSSCFSFFCCYSSICLEADWLEAHKSSKSVRTLKLKL